MYFEQAQKHHTTLQQQQQQQQLKLKLISAHVINGMSKFNRTRTDSRQNILNDFNITL